MIFPREYASCGGVRRHSDGVEEVVIAGGRYLGKHTDVVEIFDAGTGSFREGKKKKDTINGYSWQQRSTPLEGPPLPMPIANASVCQVDASSFLLIGGDTYNDFEGARELDTIYLYQCGSWTLLPQRMKFLKGQVSAVAVEKQNS